MKLKAWISAMRLRTLPLALSCILLGSFAAYANNTFERSIFILLVTTTVLLQILSNLANDYGDFVKGTDNENRLGPQRATQSGQISSSEMKLGVIITAVLSFISGITLLAFSFNRSQWITVMFFLILGVAAIFAAIYYTVGSKAYGYKGLGDLFVFVFFGIVGVGGSYFLHAKEFNLYILFPAATIGLLSAGVLNMNNMRDHENDKLSGKHTLVVQLGFEKAKLYHTVILSLALVCMFLYIILGLNELKYLLSLAVLPLLAKNIHFVWQNNSPKALDGQLKVIAMSTFLLSLLFSISAVFI